MIKKRLSVLFELFRLKDYYGKIIFITAIGIIFVPNYTAGVYLLILFANLLMVMFTFSFNNIEDRFDDARVAVKKANNPVSCDKISLRSAYVLSFSALTLSLVIYFYFGWSTFILGLTIGIMGFLYSYKKVRFKSIPIWDVLSHGVLHSLGFVATTVIFANTPPLADVFLIGIALLSISALIDLESEVRDYEGDKLAGINNTANWLNIRKTNSLLRKSPLVPLLVISIYLIVNSPPITRLILISILIVSSTQYLIIWKKRNKFINYLPYNQLSLVFISLVLLLSF